MSLDKAEFHAPRNHHHSSSVTNNINTPTTMVHNTHSKSSPTISATTSHITRPSSTTSIAGNSHHSIVRTKLNLTAPSHTERDSYSSSSSVRQSIHSGLSSNHSSSTVSMVSYRVTIIIYNIYCIDS